MRKMISVVCILAILLSANVCAVSQKDEMQQTMGQEVQLDVVVSQEQIGSFLIDTGIEVDKNSIIVAGFIRKNNTGKMDDYMPCVVQNAGENQCAVTVGFTFEEDRNNNMLSPNATGLAPISYPGITLNVTAYYRQERGAEGYKFVRLYQADAYFKYKSGYNLSNTKVTNMSATAALFGDLVPYSECLDMDFNALVQNTIEENYHYYANVYKTGTLTSMEIYESEYYLSSTEAVWIPSTLHGGLTITASIVINGTAHTDSVSIF